MEILKDFNVNIEESEIYRLLGYRDAEPRNSVIEMVREELAKCSEYIKPVLIYNKVNISQVTDNKVILENSQVFEGEYIAKKLKDCQYVIVSVTTLGESIDRVMKTYSDEGDLLQGMIVDFIGSKAIEYSGKEFWNKLYDEIKDTDMGMTPLLSPGNGDWDLTGQAAIFKCVDAGDIGVSLTESSLMKPIKSVSSIYGFGKGIGVARAMHVCSECNLKTCNYRVDSKMEVIIHDENKIKSISVDRGSILLDVLRKEKIFIPNACGGKGKCGKCKVAFIQGAGKPSESDTRLLSQEEIQSGVRLACTYKINRPIEIKILEKSEKIEVLTGGNEIDIKVDPLVKKTHIKMIPPSVEDQMSDCRRLIKTLSLGELAIDRKLMTKLPGIVREKNYEITCTTYKNILVDVESGDTTNVSYGIAVDIGTTTVACYLIDLTSGKVLDIESSVNNQRDYGADVITRINYTIENKEGLSVLHSAIVSQLNDMVSKLCTRQGVSKNNIYNMTVAGNTTMMHLFLGLECANIANAPFIPVTTDTVDVTGEEIGINIKGYVTVLPGVASYVGGDITAGILACGMTKQEGYSILLDLGTNGEMALGNKHGVISCATAAGPAFEGANIKWGVGGIKGAISKVDLSQKKIYETIGNGVPVGICGSGVLDVLSQLLKYGFIHKTGRMVVPDDPECPQNLKDRMRAVGNLKEFVLAGDIAFTQKDVRELQLAKSAISAGMMLLIKEKGIKPEDVEKIYIAGGFGNYMDIESALSIGLIPSEFRGKSESIGNSAGTGARLCLVSASSRDEIIDIIEKTGYVELSGRQDFMELYMDSMMLGG